VVSTALPVASSQINKLIRTKFLAVVLAPFFVHLEILFSLGYNPEMHKRIQNGVGLEIARFKKAEGEKKRAAKKES
jgi:uncharacterized membrane protein YGL010W